MAGQLFRYPSAGSVTLNAEGANGAAIPTDSLLVAGENPSHNLKPLQMDASGNLLVSASALPLPTGAATAANQTNGSQKTQVVDGSGNVIASTANALNVSAVQSGSWNILNISGTISLPTGAATAALQTQLSGQIPATLGAHITSASLAVNIASDQTVPVSLSSSPLPTGAATAANQTNASQKTQIVDGSGNVIASTSNALNVSAVQSGTWNITNVSGTVSLPTGASTSALQTTGNTSLASIATNTVNIPAKGQATMANSTPVVIASNQTAVPVSLASSSQPINTAGSNSTSTVSTVKTESVPANAIGFILESLDTSTANIRWAIGATASTSVGSQLQPGRDTGYVPCAANISICAESGTQNYSLQWILTQ